MIDTRTGDAMPTVPGPFGSGSFLTDGRLVAHVVGQGAFGLFNTNLQLEQIVGTADRFDDVSVLAFVQETR